MHSILWAFQFTHWSQSKERRYWRKGWRRATRRQQICRQPWAYFDINERTICSNTIGGGRVSLYHQAQRLPRQGQTAHRSTEIQLILQRTNIIQSIQWTEVLIASLLILAQKRRWPLDLDHGHNYSNFVHSASFVLRLHTSQMGEEVSSSWDKKKDR